MEEEAASVVEGPRVRNLRDIHEKAVSKILRTVTAEKLKSCFPTLYREAREVFDESQEQLVEYLKSANQSEFNRHLEHYKVVERLNEMDEVVEAAKTRQSVTMKTRVALSPEVLVEAMLRPRKEANLAELREHIRVVQQENAEALEGLERQKREIEERSKEVKEALAVVKDLVQASTSEEFVAIREARDAMLMNLP